MGVLSSPRAVPLVRVAFLVFGAVRLAEALVAANGQGPARADQAFAPLDSDCSGFTLEP